MEWIMTVIHENAIETDSGNALSRNENSHIHQKTIKTPESVQFYMLIA